VTFAVAWTLSDLACDRSSSILRSTMASVTGTLCRSADPNTFNAMSSTAAWRWVAAFVELTVAQWALTRRGNST
jgi:hypothetical protein